MTESGVSVVIVDHHEMTRAVLRQVFEEQWGWSVLGEATTGTDAVVLARTHRPDVIVADAGITDMSVDELSRLVGPPAGPSVVVALLDFPHQYASGPDSSVIKGVPMEHLRNVVLRTLQQAHPNDPRWAPNPGRPPLGPPTDPTQMGPPSPHLSGERVHLDESPRARRRRERVGLLSSLLGDEVDDVGTDAPRRGAGRDAVVTRSGSEAGAASAPDHWTPSESAASAVELPASESAPQGPVQEGPLDGAWRPVDPADGGGTERPSVDLTQRAHESPASAESAPIPPVAQRAERVERSDGEVVLQGPPSAGREAAMADLLNGRIDADSMARAAAAATDPVVGVRELAIQVFEQVPDAVDPELVTRFLVDPHAPLRARAARLLAATGRPGALEPLVARLDAEHDPSVRAELLGALVTAAGAPGAPGLDPAAALAITRAVGGLSPDLRATRRADLHALAILLGTPTLIGHLADHDPSAAQGARILMDASAVRSQAGVAPVERMVESAPVALASSLASPAPPAIRTTPGTTESQSAAYAPAPSGIDLTARPDLATGTGSGERVPSGTSGGSTVSPAMADTVDSQLLPTLIEALDDPDDQVREGAETALKDVEARRVIGWLTGRLAIGDKSAIPKLRQAGRIVDLASETTSLARMLVGLSEGEAKAGLGRIVADLPSTRPLIDGWLQSPEASQRAMAVELARYAGQLSDPAMEEALLEAVVGDTSAEVALAAAHALVDAPNAVRSHAVTAALAHPDRRVRIAGVALIPRDGDMTSLGVDLVLDHDPEVARAAADALAEFPASEVIALAWASLRSAPLAAADLMINALIRVDRPVTVRLARHAFESPDPIERVIGLEVLATLGADALEDRLATALTDPAPQVRAAALHALLNDPAGAPVDEIGRSVRDPDAEIRAAVVQVLGTIEDDRALPYLLEAARDPVNDIRDRARQSLLARPAPALADLLVSYLADPALRQAATELLMQLPPTATERVVAALGDADGETRAALSGVLAAPGAFRMLVEWSTSPDTRRRLMALNGLALVRSRDSVAALVDRLGDPDPQIRQLACVALGDLGDLGDRRAVAGLRRVMAGDPDMSVVSTAEAALRRITALGGDESIQ